MGREGRRGAARGGERSGGRDFAAFRRPPPPFAARHRHLDLLSPPHAGDLADPQGTDIRHRGRTNPVAVGGAARRPFIDLIPRWGTFGSHRPVADDVDRVALVRPARRGDGVGQESARCLGAVSRHGRRRRTDGESRTRARDSRDWWASWERVWRLSRVDGGRGPDRRDCPWPRFSAREWGDGVPCKYGWRFGFGRPLAFLDAPA